MQQRLLTQLILITTFSFIVTGCNLTSDNSDSELKTTEQRRSIETVIDDEKLERMAIDALYNNRDLWKNSEIEIVSFNKILLLIGQTPTNSLKQKAESLVNSIQGIDKIYNEIRVAAPASSLTYLSDISLTSKVKTALFSEDDLDSTKVKVVTEDGEVFLLGLVNQREADKAIDITRNVSGVKRVIQAFQITP
ncbi:BON domain-containing protein [Pleionea mediterranea]|uniref:Osmotically-inducible protein OsmY n=1 Tax=Pleionea mediterranea TaxID=523701 RepID=A0A316FHN7_9GAMM|nr:BON domain-containing protein [Pleionea mediterranea]PWK47949.1 osmotically-inducible protein OsmY [Pleionea mediterranea]